MQHPPGDGRPRPRHPAARTSFAPGERHPPGVDTHGGGLGVGLRAFDTHKGRSWWGGSRGCVTRHLLPWGVGRIRAATPCASAQLQHPRQVGPPSRLPIRPKRAAVSRLLAQSLKRDLARLGNREIAAVLERGAGLITGELSTQDTFILRQHRKRALQL